MNIGEYISPLIWDDSKTKSVVTYMPVKDDEMDKTQIRNPERYRNLKCEFCTHAFDDREIQPAWEKKWCSKFIHMHTHTTSICTRFNPVGLLKEIRLVLPVDGLRAFRFKKIGGKPRILGPRGLLIDENMFLV